MENAVGDEQLMTSKEPLNPAAVFDLLGNRRRLLVVEYLSLFEEKAAVEVRHLARVIRGIELEKDPHLVSTAEYESAYNGLIQSHLPKLATYGIIVYDDQRKVILKTDTISEYALLAQLARYLVQQ